MQAIIDLTTAIANWFWEYLFLFLSVEEDCIFP